MQNFVKKNYHKFIIYISAVLITYFTVLFFEHIHISDNIFILLIYSVATSCLLSLSFSAIYISIKSRNNTEINEYYNELRKNLIKSDTNKNPNEQIHSNSEDVLELMTINMKEIKEYYVLSKTMAAKSFHLSVIMCVLGFLLIFAAIISLFIIDINVSSIIFPVVGGVVVEVIAGTTLIVYKQSLVQLNKYYEALHSNERFLSIVNIVNKINPDKRDDVYIQIINSQLNNKC